MPFFMPDPDYPTVPPTPVPPKPVLHPCPICATLTYGTCCDEHALMTVLATFVRQGLTGDWGANALPTHRAMMTLASRGHGGNWRAELAALLAIHGVWLDDWQSGE